MKNLNKIRLLLLVIPLYLFSILYVSLQSDKPFYMFAADPSYAYLFNSLNIASGEYNSGHWDHPGCTVQIFGAIALKLTHLFSSSTELINNVLSNPEKYLAQISFLQIILLCVTIAALGYWFYSKTKDLYTTLVLQVAPLVSVYGLFHTNKLLPEFFIVLLTSIMIFLLYMYLLGIFKKGIIAILSIATFAGLLFASKFTTALLVLLPLAVIKNLRNKLLYLLFFTIVFFLAIFPIWDNYNLYLQFLNEVLNHDGIYGQGNTQVINPDKFSEYILLLLKFNPLFTILFASSIILLIIRWKSLSRSVRAFTITSLLIIVGQFVMVAKHFGFHYFFPAELIVLPCFWLLISQPRDDVIKLPRVTSKLPSNKSIVLILVSVCLISNVYHLHARTKKSNAYQFTRTELTKYSDKVVIYADDVYGAAIHPATNFASQYSGERVHLYTEILQKLHPKKYFYLKERNTITSYAGEVTLLEILATNDTVYFSEDKHNAGIINKFLSNYSNVIILDTIFKNLVTQDDRLYKLFYGKTDSPELIQIISNNFEARDSTFSRFLPQIGTVTSDAGEAQSQTHARSGQSSIRIDRSRQYAFNTLIPVTAGKHYKASVWRYGPGHSSYIVATSHNFPSFYSNGRVGSERVSDWENISISFKIPDNYPDSNVLIYLWNPTKQVAYFDDFAFYEIE